MTTVRMTTLHVHVYVHYMYIYMYMYSTRSTAYEHVECDNVGCEILTVETYHSWHHMVSK